MNAYIRQQREMGGERGDILDEEIPDLAFFSRVAWSLCVAYDVMVGDGN